MSEKTPKPLWIAAMKKPITFNLGVIFLNIKIIECLREITSEEQSILNGRESIDRTLYMQGQGNIINSQKLLETGKLITLRPHTRFIHFPPHTHDYVEMVYMCQGSTTHIVNGQTIRLEAGDLLFMNQSATHEICKAGHEDIAVNFIVLPEFFSTPLSLVGEEETPLHTFLIGCLCGKNVGSGYLHFEIADVPQVQNLMENLIWILMEETPIKRKMSQMTMALLLMQLLVHTEKLTGSSAEESVIWQVLRYIEKDYAQGNFYALCEALQYEPSWLSRQIKRKTGKTYTQLIQEKRMAQAAYLLKNTSRKVNDIALDVGYENISYFHRIFTKTFGKTPKHYRDNT